MWKLIIGVPLFQLGWELARIWTYGDWSCAMLATVARWLAGFGAAANLLAVGWVVFSVWLIPPALRSWRPRPLLAA